MSTQPKYKREAFRLYVEESKTPEQVARAVGVTKRTVENWMARARERGEAWDKARSAFMLGPGGPESITHTFVPLFFGLMNSTIRDLDSKKDMDVMDKVSALTRLTDASVKASNALGKLNPNLNRLSTAMEVIKLFNEFIAREFPQHRPAFSEILEPFGQYIVGKLDA